MTVKLQNFNMFSFKFNLNFLLYLFQQVIRWLGIFFLSFHLQRQNSPQKYDSYEMHVDNMGE